MTLVEDSSPIGEVIIDEFCEDFLISFAPFSVQDSVKSPKELGCQFMFFFSFDAKINDGTTGMEGFDDFVLVVTGEDESTVIGKFLNRCSK